MARGRKPKPNAQRRGGVAPATVEMLQASDARVVPASIVEPAVEKPDHIAANPVQSACWDSLIGTARNFEECDVPLLEAYCYWYAVLRQSELQTITEDGRVITLYGKEGEDGFVDPSTYKPNPSLRNAEKATNMLRQLGDALNLTPTARDRAGLMQAMTKSTQADVVRKTLDGYEQFKKQQKALNAARKTAGKALDAAK